MAFACILVHMKHEQPPVPNDDIETFEDTKTIDGLYEKKQVAEQISNDLTERLVEEKSTISKQDKEKILELKNQVTKDIEGISHETRDKISSTVFNRPNGDEKMDFSTPLELPQESSSWRKGVRRFTTGLLGLIGLTSAAQAEQAPGDSLLKEKTIPATVKFETARPVKKIPESYATVTRDGTTFGYTTTNGKEIQKAKPSKEQGGEEYENWLISQLQSGVSAESLAKGGYIEKSRTKEYEKFYKAPTSDVVYLEQTQEKQEVDPFAAYARDEQVLYGTDGHAFALTYAPTRGTETVLENGSKTTTENRVVAMKFIDGNTGKETGLKMIVNYNELIDETKPELGTVAELFSGMGTHLATEQGLALLKQKAEKYMQTHTQHIDASPQNLVQQNSTAKN